MARLLVAVVVAENGLLAAGPHDPATGSALAPDLLQPALVAMKFVCPSLLLSRGWPG
jgi:hypothetical protein